VNDCGDGSDENAAMCALNVRLTYLNRYVLKT